MTDSRAADTADAPEDRDSPDALDPVLARVVRDTVAVVDAPGGEASGGDAPGGDVSGAGGADAGGVRLAVWHVDVGPSTGLARLCGAWLLDADGHAEELHALLRDRSVLATDAGAAALGALGARIAGRIDPAATVAAARDDIAALQEAIDAELAASGRKLVPPLWPALPDVPDRPAQPSVPDRPAQPSAAMSAADGTAAALGLARWLVTLAEAWQDAERQRLAREFLRARGGATHRSLPVVHAGREG